MSEKPALAGFVSGTVLVYVMVATTAATPTQETTRDVCFQPRETGACRARIPQWFYNYTSELCEEFIYGGCSSSQNRFASRAACIRLCSPEICELDVVEGRCLASKKVWYYDAALGACKQFTWSGCGGNENKFSTSADCRAACHGIQHTV